jgi:hypothetical protein
LWSAANAINPAESSLPRPLQFQEKMYIFPENAHTASEVMPCEKAEYRNAGVRCCHCSAAGCIPFRIKRCA